MSKESQALLNAFRSIIEQSANDLSDLLVKRKSQNLLLRFTEEELEILDSMSLTPHQVNVLRKGIIAMGEGIEFNLLCIIDGVVDVEEAIPDLAIVDRNTKEDITEQFWHDEFIALLK